MDALAQELLGLTPAEMGEIFSKWNKGALDSFLIEITADILKQKDPASNKAFVDVVLDTAGQKGTGKWTSVNALDMGVAAPTIAESVFSRCLSAIKEDARRRLQGPQGPEGEEAHRPRRRRSSRPSTTLSTARRSAPTRRLPAHAPGPG